MKQQRTKQAKPKGNNAKAKINPLVVRRKPQYTQETSVAVAKARPLVREFAQSKNYSKAVERYLMQTISNTKAMRGPAFAGVNSSTSHVTQQFSIPPNASGSGALFMTNNPIFPLLSLTQLPDDNTEYYSSGNSSSVPLLTDEQLCLAANYVVNGEHLIYFEFANSDFFTMNFGTPTSQIGRAGWLTCDAKTIAAVVNNSAGSSQSVTGKYWFRYDSNSNWTQISTQTQTIAAGANFNFTVSPDNGLGQYTFSLSTTISTESILFNGFTWTFNGGYAWKPIGLLGRSPNTNTIKSYYDKSTQNRVIFMDLLLSNFSAEMFKNGNFSSAQVLPGGFKQLSTNPQQLLSYCSTLPSIQKVNNQQFSKGAHVPYFPCNLHELEFKETVSQNNFDTKDLQVQGWLIVWETNDSPDMLPNLKAVLQMSIEFVCSEQILDLESCPHILQLWTEWLAFRSRHCLISENPAHIKKAYQAVRKFMSENKDTIYKAGKILAQTAIEIAPLALALI